VRLALRYACAKFVRLLFVIFISGSTARGQGPVPETAPPLFPGGGFISYNLIFTTRSMMPIWRQVLRQHIYPPDRARRLLDTP
jgi:hypothetical protein